MDARYAYLIIALAASFGLAFAAVSQIASAVSDRGRVSRVYGQAVSLGFWEGLLRRGVRPFNPLACRLLRIRAVDAWARSLSEALAMQGMASDEASLCSLAVGAVIACALAGYAAGSWVAAVLLPCAALMLATAAGNRVREREAELMRDQLPDALRTMSACFHAGLTLSQAFAQLAREVPSPLGSVFRQASERLQMGASVSDALEGMRAQSGLSELSFLSVALQVQHQAGGSMQHVLESTGDSLDGELELKRSLRVKTAQARLSARVVVGVTVALVVVLSVLSHDFLSPFFESALGVGLLCVAVVMQLAGIAAVRRLLNVQVD